MKKLILSFIVSSLFISTAANAVPNTKNKWSIGIESPLTTNAAKPSIVSDNYISARWGFSDTMNLNFLGKVGLEKEQFSLTAGVQAEFKLNASKYVQPYWGAGIIIGDVGLPNNQISLVPSFGVEYFLAQNLSFDACIGLPISLFSVKDQGIKFGGFYTSGRPVLGFHYYF